MMRNAIIVIVVLIILGGGYFLFASKQNNQPKTASPQPSAAMQSHDSMKASPAPSNASPSAEASGAMANNVKEFTVTGSSFKFEPSTLTVNKGDKVKVTFKNAGGMHDFVIDEFNVKTNVIDTGKEETAEFTADKAGTFKYYCSVANHRAMGMEGTLTVK